MYKVDEGLFSKDCFHDAKSNPRQRSEFGLFVWQGARANGYGSMTRCR
jgi:hypothetical protein